MCWTENKEYGMLQALSILDNWIIWTEKLGFEGRVFGINISILKMLGSCLFHDPGMNCQYFTQLFKLTF